MKYCSIILKNSKSLKNDRRLGFKKRSGCLQRTEHQHYPKGNQILFGKAIKRQDRRSGLKIENDARSANDSEANDARSANDSEA